MLQSGKELLKVGLLDLLKDYKVNGLMLFSRYLKCINWICGEVYFRGSNGLVAIVFNALWSLFSQISIVL